jgi:hypothetical protein
MVLYYPEVDFFYPKREVGGESGIKRGLILFFLKILGKKRVRVYDFLH